MEIVRDIGGETGGQAMLADVDAWIQEAKIYGIQSIILGFPYSADRSILAMLSSSSL